MIKIKRIYEDVNESDGYRVLVDRVWPRGISKEKAHLDQWLKEVGPSKELRQWFNHEDSKYPEFKERYLAELHQGAEAVALQQLQQLVKEHETVTLLYGAKNELHNQAVVLQAYLEGQLQ